MKKTQVNEKEKTEGSAQAKVDENLNDAFRRLADGIARTQVLMKANRLDEAEIVITQLISQYNNVSVLYDLQGNIFYLKKDLDKAAQSYKRSLNLSPDNATTAQILKEINAGRHRVPAEATGGVQ